MIILVWMTLSIELLQIMYEVYTGLYIRIVISEIHFTCNLFFGWDVE